MNNISSNLFQIMLPSFADDSNGGKLFLFLKLAAKQRQLQHWVSDIGSPLQR
jgi:hypothetical protein